MKYERYQFPKFSGARCVMMPIVQGDPRTLPPELKGYSDFVERNALERGSIGFLTVDESHVQEGRSQRGYGSSDRTLHTEACRGDGYLSWGPPSWGGSHRVTLAPATRVIISNSVDDTCMVWDAEETEITRDGDLGHVAHKYPRETGRMLKSGEISEIGIFTPHECIPQMKSGPRQFVRLVGVGVVGRERHFTRNPILGM